MASDSVSTNASFIDPAKRWMPALLIALLVLLVSGAFLYGRLGRRSAKGEQDEVQVTPLTTLPGTELSPSFSPDGSQVAFAWTGPDGKLPSWERNEESFDLYVKAVGAENVERLTHKGAAWIVPAWSPDGRNIAFARLGAANGGIFMIPARGGPERRLADFTTPAEQAASLNWSPDGRFLIYSSGGQLRVLTPETGVVRELPVPARCKEPYAPVFSPNGATIAFSCYQDDMVNDIYTMRQDGGGAKYLSTVSAYPAPMTWSRDGQRIILSNEGQLAEVSKDGGKPRRLLFAQDGWAPTISLHGGRFAYVKFYNNSYLFKVATDPAASRSGTVIAPSTRQQRCPDISPDGRRIAFESERSGGHEVWAANLDGTDPVQLSNFHSLTGTPRWSPDGRQIVFDSRESGQAALYLVDPETAIPRRIPIKGHVASVPSWSRDGKWIYFSAGGARREGLYKVSPQGGDPTLVTTTHGNNVQESQDGKSLYFAFGEFNAEIYVKDKISGEERPVRGIRKGSSATEWVLTATGIYFIDRSSEGLGIAFFDFAEAKITRRIPIEKQAMTWGGLAISPDGKWLVYSQIDEMGTDLMLAEGFR